MVETDAATTNEVEVEESIAVDALAEGVPAAPVAPPEPTLQARNLGGKFLEVGADIRLYNVLCQRQVGKPTVATVPVKKMVTVMTKETNEAGEEVEVKKTVEQEVHERQVSWAWGDPEVYGDPFASLTGALRAQAILAKSFRESGYAVKENIKAEYGVWYVTDPEGVRDGYRFSITLGDRKPAPPPKEKKVKEPKPPKEPKEPKAPKAAKKAKATVTGADGTKVNTPMIAPENVVNPDDVEVSE